MKNVKNVILVTLVFVMTFPMMAQAMSSNQVKLTTQELVEQAGLSSLQTMNAKKEYFEYYLPVGYKRLNSRSNELVLSFNHQTYLVKIDIAQAYREFIALRTNQINEFYSMNADSQQRELLEVIDPYKNFYLSPEFDPSMIIFHSKGLVTSQMGESTPYVIDAVRVTPDSEQVIVKLKVGSVTVQTASSLERLESSIQDMMLIARNVKVDVTQVAISEYQYSARSTVDLRGTGRNDVPTDGVLADLNDPTVNPSDLSNEVDLIESELERNRSNNQQLPGVTTPQEQEETEPEQPASE